MAGTNPRSFIKRRETPAAVATLRRTRTKQFQAELQRSLIPPTARPCIADPCAWRSAGHASVAVVSSRELDEQHAVRRAAGQVKPDSTPRRRPRSQMLALTDSALARLAIAATCVDPRRALRSRRTGGAPDTGRNVLMMPMRALSAP